MSEPSVLQLGPLVSIHLKQWAENAGANGYRVHIGGLAPIAGPAVDFDGVAESVHVGPQARPPFTTLVWVPWLRRLVRRLRPTVIHAHQPTAWGLYAALAGVRPLVVSAWGSEVYLAGREARVLSRLALRRADRLLAPSRHLIETMIARGADPSRCEEVDLGVDLEQFSPGAASDAAEVRAELDLGNGPILLSFRGGTPVYNLPVLVEAFARLRRRVPDARLLVATGSAALAPEARAALARPDLDDAMRALGDVPHGQMARYLRAADVGISVPSSDAAPRSVWEAMACGVPVLASDLPQLRERLGTNAGASFVPIDPEAIAGALEDLLGDPGRMEAMGRAGRGWASANVDRKDHVARLGRAYADAVRRARR